MSKQKIAKGPDFIHPEKASAIGSRNSLYRDGRDEYAESALMVDEEVEKILNHVSSQLPPEVLSKLDVMGGIKSKIHNYYNQNLQNMLNRYLVTAEDELSKKYRNLVDREEHSQLARYTPRNVSDLMSRLGQEGSFTTGAVEKAMANAYEHLQGHVERSIKEMEHHTNTLMAQKTDAGAFVRNEASYCLVKCNFKNNSSKPKTVMDVRLAFNVADQDLRVPIHHYQKPIQGLLKEIVSNHFHRQIDEKIDRINQSLTEDGQPQLSANQEIFEKFKALENFIGFDSDLSDPNNKAYEVIAKKFIDTLEDTYFEMPASESDPTAIRENLKHILDEGHLLHKGFNHAVNMMTSILDTAKMGFQYLDNLKNGRVCVIREYAETNANELPDETYQVRMSYLDREQINALKKAYDEQSKELLERVNEAAEVVTKVYNEYARENNFKSYHDVSEQYLKTDGAEGEERIWNEVLFQEITGDIRSGGSTQRSFETIKKQLRLMKKKVLEIYKNQHPRNRFVIEERINFLEDQFLAFGALVNPYHLQQGLLVEVDITTVKKKRTNMAAMSNVLSEFMYRITNEFVDRASGEFPKEQRRSEKIEERRFVSVLQGAEEKLQPVT
ncbi:MAG: cytoplasmic filament protein CfpA [bacterium]|nr:cytoplasmic filament protein CfpA [bacterium]